jgi:hypothetical protein
MTSLAIGFPQRSVTFRAFSGIAREVLLISVSMALYTLVRILVRGQSEQAVANAQGLMDLERDLGILWELDVQGALMSHALVAGALNFVYLYGHLPLIGLFAVWMYGKSPSRYLLLRNAFLLSGALSLFSFSLFPAAPPRLMPGGGFIDTVFGAEGQTLSPEFLMNPYAAMPSLHFGWSLLLGLGVFWTASRPEVRLLGLLWPAIMCLTIVATANHYLLDAAGGLIAVSLGFALALKLRSLAQNNGRMPAPLTWLAGHRPHIQPHREQTPYADAA